MGSMYTKTTADEYNQDIINQLIEFGYNRHEIISAMKTVTNKHDINDIQSVLDSINDDNYDTQQLTHSWKLIEKSKSTEMIENNDDIKHQNESIITNETLQKDKSIQNIISALKYYQTILNNQNYDDLISEYFGENTRIIEDYSHILKKYLNNTIESNTSIFSQIYNIMIKEIKCDIKNCKQYSRNNRDRQKEPKSTNDNKDDDVFRITFYTDLMDTIHCYFMHSYDIGFRLRSTELR